jgi:addiction module HigA family antidote
MIPKHRCPTKPGVLIQDLLDECGLTQLELATKLRVKRRVINAIIKGERRLRADLAIKLAKVFQTTPEFWLNLQTAADIWSATQQVKVQNIKPIIKPGSYWKCDKCGTLKFELDNPPNDKDSIIEKIQNS